MLARPSATADHGITIRRPVLVATILVGIVLGVLLSACGGPPTPWISQPESQPEAGAPEPSASTSSAPSPGASAGPESPAPAASQAPTNPANPGAPGPAGSAQPSNVPAGLVGTWTATISGGVMTKVLRADATYSETWADPTAPCQANGSLQVNGPNLTLNPTTTNCSWGVSVFRYALDANTLTLTTGALDQTYTRG